MKSQILRGVENHDDMAHCLLLCEVPLVGSREERSVACLDAVAHGKHGGEGGRLDAPPRPVVPARLELEEQEEGE